MAVVATTCRGACGGCAVRGGASAAKACLALCSRSGSCSRYSASCFRRRNQQTLEELQRPVYEEPEEPASRKQPQRSAPPPAPPAPPPAKKLTIFLRDATGDKQKFIVKSDTKFEAVFDAYCTARGLEQDAVRFLFDGDALAPSATPSQLDLDDEDCIDVKRL